MDYKEDHIYFESTQLIAANKKLKEELKQLDEKVKREFKELHYKLDESIRSIDAMISTHRYEKKQKEKKKKGKWWTFKRKKPRNSF